MPRLAALAAIVFWGISFVATKSVLREISPVSLIFIRFALGTALLHGILLARRERLIPPPATWAHLALMGFIGVFVHQMMQAWALTMTTAVKTGWLIGLIPIWSAILAAIFLHERFGAMKSAGLVFGLAGALLVITRGDLRVLALPLPSTRGDFLILASTINWAVYTVASRSILRRLGALEATAGSMLLGWLMLAPFFVAKRGWLEIGHLSPGGWGALLFLGVACSGLGYFFWYGALEKVEASQVAAFLYLEPLVTLAAAVALLHEPVPPSTIVGGVTVLAGVALMQRAARRKPPELAASSHGLE
ncbi:MAG: DMT family transporter [Thermoanaerobaculia bacterium]